VQDILGMDEKLRRDNPAEEQINVPANPKHYWRLVPLGDANNVLIP
jgi:4-alpha-glucanotransferase